jgi:predicted lipid carrier protein YhbT
MLALAPLPLMQTVLNRVVRKVPRERPELFRRLGLHQQKTFLIDPVNLPFLFTLKPMALQPELRIHPRTRTRPLHDAHIAGTFFALLDMIDGALDGDALFFTRDLLIEGDTEAVVVLRNALDDLEGSIIDDMTRPFDFVARRILSRLRDFSAGE